MDIIAERPEITLWEQKMNFIIQSSCIFAEIAGVVICYLSQTAVYVFQDRKVYENFLHFRLE